MATDTEMLNWIEDHVEEIFSYGTVGKKDTTVIKWVGQGGKAYRTESTSLREAIAEAIKKEL